MESKHDSSRLKGISLPGREISREYRKKPCHELRGGARPFRGVYEMQGLGKISAGRTRSDLTVRGWISWVAFDGAEKRIGRLSVWEQTEQGCE